MVGSIATGIPDWQPVIDIEGGRLDPPGLTLTIRLAKTKRKRPIDMDDNQKDYVTASYQWCLVDYDDPDQKKIHFIVCSDFPDWYDNNSQVHNIPAVKKITAGDDGKHLLVIECTVGNDCFCTNFPSPNFWNRVGDDVKQQLTKAATNFTTMTFIVKPKPGFRPNLNVLIQRQNQGLNYLSQYKDPETKEDNFLSMSQAPTIQDVGDGMYKKKDGTFYEIQTLPRFTSGSQFGTITSLSTPGCAIRQRTQDRVSGQAVGNLQQGHRIAEDPWSDLPTEVYDHHFYCYIRLPVDEAKSIMPDADTPIEVKFAGIGDTCLSTTRSCPAQELAKTATDFMAVIAYNPSVVTPHLQTSLALLDELPKIFVKIRHSFKSYIREIHVAQNIGHTTHLPARNIRQQLMNGKVVQETTIMNDPTGKRDQEFRYCVNLAKEKLANDVQVEVIASLRRIRNKLLLVKGPPGTGKTKMIAYMIWVLVKFGHKVACAAPSNKAAFNMLLTVLANKPKWADQGMTAQFLRVTTSSIGKHIIPYEVAPDDMDVSKPLPTPYKASQVEDDSKVDDTIEHLVAQYADDEAKWFEWATRVNDWNSATEDVRFFEHGTVTESEVPYHATMGFYIHKIMEADAGKAKADHEAQHGRALVNEDSTSDLNPSALYKSHYDAFVAVEGKVPYKAKGEFFRSRREREARVLKRTDGIFSTINNLGSRDFEEEGFSAGYIFIDGGGQTSVASLAVALTKFTKFEAAVLIGDPMQLPLTILAKLVSEVIQYSQLSPMELCASHRLPMTTLTIQYRMAEEIALWPSNFNYEGALRNHSTTTVDNAWRQAVRAICLEDYGIKGESGN